MRTAAHPKTRPTSYVTTPHYRTRGLTQVRKYFQYTNIAFHSTEASDMDAHEHWGQMSTYGAGGFYALLGASREEAEKVIQELKVAFQYDFH